MHNKLAKITIFSLLNSHLYFVHCTIDTEIYIKNNTNGENGTQKLSTFADKSRIICAGRCAQMTECRAFNMSADGCTLYSAAVSDGNTYTKTSVSDTSILR